MADPQSDPKPRLSPVVLPVLWRMSLLASVTVIIGFPIVVRLLGYHVHEGWALISAHPRFFMSLVLFPYLFAIIGTLDALARDWIAARESRPRSRDGLPDDQHD